MTKDEKTLELVNRAVASLKSLPPQGGVSEPQSIEAYYAIFDGPVRWKAGVRTPQEASVPARKALFGTRMHERGKPLMTF